VAIVDGAFSADLAGRDRQLGHQRQIVDKLLQMGVCVILGTIAAVPKQANFASEKAVN